jgi:hypothetical protein
MKKINLFLITTVLVVAIIFNACVKDHSIGETKETLSDYMAFGHFYGECMGENCIEMYRLGNTALFEDVQDHYPDFQKPYDGNYVKLSEAKFQMVKDFESKIPKELFSETKTVIGQPDAGDWGGIYIEISKNGSRKFWYIDKMQSNLPNYLRSFVDTVSSDIEKLY